MPTILHLHQKVKGERCREKGGRECGISGFRTIVIFIAVHVQIATDVQGQGSQIYTVRLR